MQAVDKLKATSRPLIEAANQEFTPKVREQVARLASSGWDPYEVWRRMIKEPRDQRQTQTR